MPEHVLGQRNSAGVKRATLYGHLDKTTVGGRPRAAKNDASSRGVVATAPAPASEAASPGSQPVSEPTRQPERPRPSMTTTRCPTCGHEPAAARDRWRQRQDLTVTWLYSDPGQPGQVTERRHCTECQPHEHVAGIECAACGDGPLLAGALADTAVDGTEPPEPVRGWLTAHGWYREESIGWICGDRRH